MEACATECAGVAKLLAVEMIVFECLYKRKWVLISPEQNKNEKIKRVENQDTHCLLEQLLRTIEPLAQTQQV